MPEKFDFSKIEDQEKVEKLKSYDKDVIRDSAEDRAILLQKIVSDDKAKDFGDAENFLAEREEHVKQKIETLFWEKINKFEKLQAESEILEKKYHDYIATLNDSPELNISGLDRLIEEEVIKREATNPYSKYWTEYQSKKLVTEQFLRKIVFDSKNSAFKDIVDFSEYAGILLKEFNNSILEKIDEIKKTDFGKKIEKITSTVDNIKEFIDKYPTHLITSVYYSNGKICGNRREASNEGISLSENIMPYLISRLEYLLLDIRDYENWEQEIESKIICIPESRGKFAVHSTTLSGIEKILSEPGYKGQDSWVFDKFGDFKNPTWGFLKRDNNFTLKDAFEIQKWLFENNNSMDKGSHDKSKKIKPLTDEQYEYVKNHPIVEDQKEQDDNTMQILDQIKLMRRGSWNLYTAQFGLMTKIFSPTNPNESIGNFSGKNSLGIVLYKKASEINLEMIVKMIKRVFKNNPHEMIPVYDNDGNLLWPKKMTREEISKFIKERSAKIKPEDVSN